MLKTTKSPGKKIVKDIKFTCINQGNQNSGMSEY